MSASTLTSDEPHVPHDTVKKLVVMANQISQFFASQGREEKAVAATADHIKSFWTPDMRRALIEKLDTVTGLSPISLGAMKTLRDAAPGTIRADLARMGEPSGRAPGNDAG
jgi:formate dehydrogenase subunit delta